MKLTKILALVLALIMVMAVFAACNPDPTPTPDPDPDTDQSGDDNNDDNNNDNNNNDDNNDDTPENTDKVVTLAEYLQLLKNSPFTIKDTVAKGNIGLSDGKIVGVDQDRYENEVLYPVPADSEFGDRIYKVEDYGITTDSADNTTALNDLIKDLKDVEGLKKIVFTAGGVYKFKRTINVKGINDLYICSSDPEENFEILMVNWAQAIAVEECDNLHFNNYSLDYDPSPTVAGTITAFDKKGGTITLVIDEEFDLTKSVYRNGLVGNGCSYIEFTTDEITGDPIPDFKHNILCSYPQIQGSTYNAATREFVIKVDPKQSVDSVVGNRASIAFTMYEYFGFHADNCGKVYLEGVDIYTTGGMAFGGGNMDGFYLNDVNLDLREGSGRLMTATADGFHTCDVLEIKITNSTFQYSHDDAFNIKNTYTSVISAVNKKITLSAAPTYVIEVGDVLELYEPQQMLAIGQYKVTKVEYLPGSTIEVTVDKRVDGNAADAFCSNTTRATRFTLENNIIGNKRNRGILFQSRDSVIRNNTFRNIRHGAVCIFTVRDQFKEGVCPYNVTVENNKFIGNMSGDVNFYTWGEAGHTNPGTGVLNKMTVRNNFSYGSKSLVFSISGVGDSTFTNNLVYNPCLYDTDAKKCYVFNIDRSKDLTIKDNLTYIDWRSDFKININESNLVENITKENNKFLNISKD